MTLELRLGLRSLAWGVFYHWQKRILYLHPVPGVGLVVHFRKRAAQPVIVAPIDGDPDLTDDHLCWGPVDRKVGDRWQCATCHARWECVPHHQGGTVWLRNRDES